MWQQYVESGYRGVFLVPTGAISGVSKAIEKGVPGVVEVSRFNQGGPGSSFRYLHLLVRCHPLASKVLYFPEGFKQITSHTPMPMLATLYHHDDGTLNSFLALKSHEASPI